MTAQYKDFNKDVKDLLAKNVTAPGTWKLESKLKAGNCVVFNPKADNKGVTADVEMTCPRYGEVWKLTCNAAGEVKPKVTYKGFEGHKIEVNLSEIRDAANADSYELVYEGTVAGVVINNNLKVKSNEFAVAYKAIPQLTVGAQLSCKKGESTPGWSAGLLFKDAGRQVAVTTKNAKTYTTGVLFPLKAAGYDFKIAAQVDCGGGKAVSYKFGTEFKACTAAVVKVSANAAGEVALAVVHKFATGWKAAASVELHKLSPKVGLSLTLE